MTDDRLARALRALADETVAAAPPAPPAAWLALAARRRAERRARARVDRALRAGGLGAGLALLAGLLLHPLPWALAAPVALAAAAAVARAFAPGPAPWPDDLSGITSSAAAPRGTG
ncbi:MAG: hypothetical protein QM704_22330 [Anaeromyxobacteraceae bacterium]